MSGTGTNRRAIGGDTNMRKTWKQRAASLLIGTLVGMGLVAPAFPDATLLPNAKQQYTDDANVPVASGRVDYYIPSTSTRKTVWSDAAQTAAQTNGVLLDAAGRPQPTGQTYGDGLYRQVVKDVNGVVIWDAVTSSTGGSSSGGGGTTVGDGAYVGNVMSWSGLTPPPNYLFAYGQRVSRTTYSMLFSTITIPTTVICTAGLNVLSGIADTQSIQLGGAIEASCVAPGTTVVSKATTSVTVSANASVSTAVAARFFPWGNGDGSTTFNIPDLRARSLIGRANMGGTDVGVISTTNCGGATPAALGARCGFDSTTLFLNNLPPITPTGTIANGTITNVVTGGTLGATSTSTAVAAAGVQLLTGSTSIVVTSTQGASTFTGTGGGGVSQAFSNVSPGMTMNYVIKALPDASTTVASGVASIAGMTGVLTCGSGLNCSGNNIDTVPTPNAVIIIGTTPVAGGATDAMLYKAADGTVGVSAPNAVNVENYGAVANDNTKGAVNQAAFNAAFAASPNVMCVAGKTYYTQRVAPPSNAKTLNLDCNLVANGVYAGSTGVVDIQSVTSGSFTLQGVGSITVSNAVYPTISAVKAFSTNHTTIDGITISGGTNNIQFGNQSFTTISNTTLSGYGTRGISLALISDSVNIIDNKITGGFVSAGGVLSDHAVSIEAVTDKLTITGNQVFSSLGWGYSVQQTSNFNVCGNVSTDSRLEGLVVGQSSSKGIICNNTLTFGAVHAELGLSVELTTDFVVTGNTLYGPVASCMYFGTGVAQGNVTGNNCTTVAQRTVSNATNNGSGLIRLTLNTTSGYVSGMYIQVSGILGTTEANNFWIIDVINGTQVDLRETLLTHVPSAFVHAYISGGKIGDPNWTGVAFYQGAGGVSVSGNKFRDANAVMQFFVKEFDAPSAGNSISTNYGDAPQVSTISVQSSASTVFDAVGMTVANLPTTAKNGSRIFTTDGTPGTSPLSGGGTGAWAIRINGVWQTEYILTSPLPATAGGTGQSSYTTGDLLYASSSTALSKLADIATGNALISGGIGIAPSWGKITSSHITAAALSKTDDTNVTATLGGTPTLALVNAASITLGWTGQLSVARGGTGLASGTSGGIPYFNSTSTMASSGLLTANALMLGGGAGASPTVLGSLGTTTTLLHGNAAGAPSFGAVVSADMNITTTSCTNQFVTAISAGGVGTCTTDTLASAQHANQGTTTTVLHGNASGNPSWAAVNYATDGTGFVPVGNGGVVQAASTYAVTVGCNGGGSAGTTTATGRQITNAKLVFVQVDLSSSGGVTCGAGYTITLPSIPQSTAVFPGINKGTSTNILASVGTAGVNSVTMVVTAAAGQFLSITGTYESQ